MDVNLLNDRTCRVHVFDPLQSDVFAVREFHYILDAIDDLESADFVDETYVAGVNPAFFVDRLFCGFRVYAKRVNRRSSCRRRRGYPLL